MFGHDVRKKTSYNVLFNGFFGKMAICCETAIFTVISNKRAA